MSGVNPPLRVTKYVKKSEFERGDIVLVGFDPASAMNSKVLVDLRLCSPFKPLITGNDAGGPHYAGRKFCPLCRFSVPLHCEEGDVHGVVLVNRCG